MMMIEIFANEIKSTIEFFLFLPLANKVWGRVMLSHLSVHGGYDLTFCVWSHVPYRGLSVRRRVCLSGEGCLS